MKSTNDAPRLISLSPLRHSDQQDGSYHSYGNVNTPSPSPRRLLNSEHGDFFHTKDGAADPAAATGTLTRKSRIGKIISTKYIVFAMS